MGLQRDRTEVGEHAHVHCLHLKERTLTAFSMCPRGSGCVCQQGGLANTRACGPGPTLYMPPANHSKRPLLGWREGAHPEDFGSKSHLHFYRAFLFLVFFLLT